MLYDTDTDIDEAYAYPTPVEVVSKEDEAMQRTLDKLVNEEKELLSSPSPNLEKSRIYQLGEVVKNWRDLAEHHSDGPLNANSCWILYRLSALFFSGIRKDLSELIYEFAPKKSPSPWKLLAQKLGSDKRERERFYSRMQRSLDLIVYCLESIVESARSIKATDTREKEKQFRTIVINVKLCQLWFDQAIAKSTGSESSGEVQDLNAQIVAWSTFGIKFVAGKAARRRLGLFMKDEQSLPNIVPVTGKVEFLGLKIHEPTSS